MQSIDLQTHKNTLHKIFSLHDKRDLTIDCVLEGTMCNVIADDQTSPSVFLIQNGSFYILGGAYFHENADELLTLIPLGATVISSPLSWTSKLLQQKNITLQEYERYSFCHANISLDQLGLIIDSKPSQLTITKIDATFASRISQEKTFQYHFQNFKSESDFLNIGIGYVAIIKGEIIGMASSALVCSKGFEISIMILAEFRGKKFGKTLAAYLVRAILMQHKIPHWDAANKTSLNLAKQLGYEFKEKYIAYRIVEA